MKLLRELITSSVTKTCNFSQSHVILVSFSTRPFYSSKVRFTIKIEINRNNLYQINDLSKTGGHFRLRCEKQNIFFVYFWSVNITCKIFEQTHIFDWKDFIKSVKCSLSCWDVTKKTGGKLVQVFNFMVPLTLNLSNEKCRNVNQII